MGLSRTMLQVTRHSERIARHGMSGPRVTHWMGAVWRSRGGCATRLRAAFVRTVMGVHRAGCSQGRVPFSKLFTNPARGQRAEQASVKVKLYTAP